ncbi:MAG TPA: cobalamin biosynthesis protein P47K, partial [Pirellulales bacterium]
GLRILRGERGFSSKAEYIFRKQLEEADLVFINRIDEITPDEAAQLETLVQQIQPGLPVLKGSAKTGARFEALLSFLDQEGDFGRRILDIDYDVYAEGEAELGWLNATFELTSDHDVPLDDVLATLVHELKEALDAQSVETAHLKVIGLADETFGVANLVSRYTAPEISARAGVAVRTAKLVVNARAAIDPETLAATVRSETAEAGRKLAVQIQEEQLRAFRPGRPQPTHRAAKAT